MTKRNKDIDQKQLLDTIKSNNQLFQMRYLYLTQKNLEKIYNEVLGNKLPTVPDGYSYGPLNKNVTTKIFDIIFPLIIEDMLNRNTSDYKSNITYYKDNSAVVRFVINTEHLPYITELDGTLSKNEDNNIIFNKKNIEISKQDFILADFIKNINFTHLELDTNKVNYYMKIIEEFYNVSNNLANINFLLNDRDPTDNWLLKHNISDSAKVAINLYTTTSYNEINKVMFNCNELLFNNILWDSSVINLALLTVSIASMALINYPNQPTNTYIVNRFEYFNTDRIAALMSSVCDSKTVQNSSLTSTSISNDMEGIHLIIKTKGLYIAPLSACPDENEVLLPASQHILFYAYKQIEEHNIVFVGEAVNLVPDYINANTV